MSTPVQTSYALLRYGKGREVRLFREGCDVRSERLKKRARESGDKLVVGCACPYIMDVQV